MQAQKTNPERLGKIGEMCVKSFIESIGGVCVLSENYYDSEKDMTIYQTDGRFDGKIEVKTQVPYIKNNL